MHWLPTWTDTHTEDMTKRPVDEIIVIGSEYPRMSVRWRYNQNQRCRMLPNGKRQPITLLSKVVCLVETCHQRPYIGATNPRHCFFSSQFHVSIFRITKKPSINPLKPMLSDVEVSQRICCFWVWVISKAVHVFLQEKLRMAHRSFLPPSNLYTEPKSFIFTWEFSFTWTICKWVDYSVAGKGKNLEISMPSSMVFLFNLFVHH